MSAKPGIPGYLDAPSLSRETGTCHVRLLPTPLPASLTPEGRGAHIRPQLHGQCNIRTRARNGGPANVPAGSRLSTARVPERATAPDIACRSVPSDARHAGLPAHRSPPARIPLPEGPGGATGPQPSRRRKSRNSRRIPAARGLTAAGPAARDSPRDGAGARTRGSAPTLPARVRAIMELEGRGHFAGIHAEELAHARRLAEDRGVRPDRIRGARKQDCCISATERGSTRGGGVRTTFGC